VKRCCGSILCRGRGGVVCGVGKVTRKRAGMLGVGPEHDRSNGSSIREQRQDWSTMGCCSEVGRIEEVGVV
jgi:hypothetical protein